MYNGTSLSLSLFLCVSLANSTCKALLYKEFSKPNAWGFKIRKVVFKVRQTGSCHGWFLKFFKGLSQ